MFLVSFFLAFALRILMLQDFFMTFAAVLHHFYRRSIVPTLLFLLLAFSGVTPLALASQASTEISRIMKERSSVEETLKNLKEQLKEYQSKLSSATRKESQSVNALQNMRTQILVLEKMITQNQNYLKKLDADINRLQSEFKENRQVYGRVSDDFRRTAISVYKYGGNRDIERVFAAGSVNSALVRTQYMGVFTRAVSSHVDQLQQVAVKIENNRAALEQSYQQKAETVKEQERQLQNWNASKKEKERLLDQIKKNKQEYAAQLSVIQKKRRQLQSRIESLILAEQRAVEAENERQRKILEARRLETQRREAERAQAQLIAKKEKSITKKEKASLPVPVASPITPPEKKSVTVVPRSDSPELERVSADFDTAIGSLPWPVRTGVISQKFGSVEDKELKIVTTNNGIDISVPANTPVRAVSGGKVVQIAFLPTFGNIVIIRHPKSYLTVYANLGQLSVVKDDIIKSQQLVGVSGRMAEGGAVVHFEIWKGRVKQNPEKWLRR